MELSKFKRLCQRPYFHIWLLPDYSSGKVAADCDLLNLTKRELRSSKVVASHPV